MDYKKICNMGAIAAMSLFSPASTEQPSLTKDISEAIGTLQRGIYDVFKNKREEENSKRIMDQVLQYYMLHKTEQFKEDYKLLIDDLLYGVYIRDVRILDRRKDPSEIYPTEKSLEGTIIYKWKDERIPSYVFGIEVDLEPLCSEPPCQNNNYNVDFSTIKERSSNIRFVEEYMKMIYKGDK